MGWEGTTGHLYVCGSCEQAKGGCTRYDSIHGRKIKALCGKYSSLVALCDGWEFEWITKEICSFSKSLSDIKIHQVAFGKTHAVALSLDGHIYTWGEGEFGQLGLGGNIKSSDQPTRVTPAKNTLFSSVASGGYHSMAITNSGDLFSWGRNFEGQLGHFTKAATSTDNELFNGIFHHPKYVAAFLHQKCKQVSCGDKFSVLLTTNGEVYTFGEGQAGQLGYGRCTKGFQPKITLKPKNPNESIVEVACGWAHVVALSSDGNVYGWGFNQYGQLGLGDTKTRFYPEVLSSINCITKIFAGGNYSAAISNSGELLTWGNSCVRGPELPEQPSPQHTLTPAYHDALRGVYVESVACASNDMIIFAPSWVADIFPIGGGLEGGTMLKIKGSGFWNSDDITVRFSPLTEGRLPRAVLAQFDESSGMITCEAPKFSCPGDFAVEVAMNGKHFTTNGNVFEVFTAPTPTFISHEELPLISDIVLELHLRGDKPKSSQAPTIRWVPLNTSVSPIIVPGVYGSIDVTPNNESPDDGLMQAEETALVVPTFKVSFPPPKFHDEVDELIPCHVEISYNGQDFKRVELHVNGSILDPHIVYFHDARITSCNPNSMAITENGIKVRIEIDQLFDIGRVVCKAQYSDTNEELNEQRTVSANLTVISVNPSEKFIECKVPPFSKWQFSCRRIVADEENNTTAERRYSLSVAAEKSREMWSQTDSTQLRTELLVSLNNGKTFLPSKTPQANSFYAYKHGTLTALNPRCGPLTGGTIVHMNATHLSFDTKDSIVSVEYNGDLQTVASYVHELAETKEFVATFQIPSFLPAESSEIPSSPPNTPSTLNPVSICFGLSGVSYGESNISFEFYRNPEIRSIEPSAASPGMILHLAGAHLRANDGMKCKLERDDGSFTMEVKVDYKEEKTGPCYKLELPTLGSNADGELRFFIALNGQQYTTSDTAKFIYTDQPEVPPGKEDKKKH